MMTYLHKLNKMFAFAVVMVATALLLAGCAGELVEVPRDAAAPSDLVLDTSSDVATDQMVDKDITDVPVFPDTPDADASTDVPNDTPLDFTDADITSPDVPDGRDVIGDEAFTDVASESPCPPGMATTCAGRCVSVQTDPAHCGACNRACFIPNGTAGCAAGACTVAACNTGFADCDGVAMNGCEVNLANTALHCGACAIACAEPTPLCSVGICSNGCTGPGETRCGTSCVNTQLDNSNCGRCGNVCVAVANSVVACTAGGCRIICNVGFHDCGGACVSDVAVEACGTRCEPCPTPANSVPTCVAGGCGFTCAMGFADCDGVAMNGCEVNLATSVNHCGVCGASCGAADCMSGACELDTYVTSIMRAGADGSTFAIARAATRAEGSFDGMGGAATFTNPSASTVVRGWVTVPLPRGTLLSASVTFSAPYQLVGDRNPGMGIQLVSFIPAGAVPVPDDFVITRWGSEGFLPMAIPIFSFTPAVTTVLNPAGISYLQTRMGTSALMGMRTNYDIENREPTVIGFAGIEFGVRTPPPVRFRFRYRP